MAIHEECGVFGISDPRGDCARTAYYGLYSLQHRGQEACGIATINDRELSYHKDVGLVGEVFTPELLHQLDGTMAVGHVRYATTGGTRRENAQPLTLKYVKGTLALAHNGNLVGTQELRTGFEYRGAIFQTTTDSELIAYAIAQERLRCGSAEEAVVRAMKLLRGAYSLIVMSPQKLIAARDPWGFRPLCMGRRGDAVIRELCPPRGGRAVRAGTGARRGGRGRGDAGPLPQGELRRGLQPYVHLRVYLLRPA